MVSGRYSGLDQDPPVSIFWPGTPAVYDYCRCSYNLSVDRWEFYDAQAGCPERVVYRRPVNALEQADGVSVHCGDGGWMIERLSP